MSKKRPLVSIGMPVYNEEKYIAQTLDSLLAQDFKDFELIISDNSSTDSTDDICQAYLARDKRIRYYRNQVNIGALANFKRVFELSSGEYFMWAGAHDLWARSFISRCLEILVSDPSVVLCYSRIMHIDWKSRPLGIAPEKIDTRSLNDTERYHRLIWEMRTGNAVYGLMRAGALRQAHLWPIVRGPDIVLLTELILLGTFAQIPEPLFLRRMNRPPETREQYKARITSMLVTKNKARLRYLPHFWELYEYLAVIMRANVGYGKKVRLLINMLNCFYVRSRSYYKEDLVDLFRIKSYSKILIRMTLGLLPTSGSASFIRVIMRYMPVVGRELRTLWLAGLSEKRSTLVIDFDGQKIEVNLQDELGRDLFFHRNYERTVTNLLLRRLKSNTIFVDIGANIGFYSLLAAKRLSEGRVYAFEPSPEICEKLLRNIRLNNYSNIHVEQQAVCDSDGKAEFFPLLQPDDQGAGKLFDPYGDSDSLTVDRCTLDSFVKQHGIARIDIIKIDVEGVEHMVLKGMSELIACDRPPELIIELHPSDLLRMGSSVISIKKDIAATGYNIYRITDDKLIPEPVKDDHDSLVHLFCTKEPNMLTNDNTLFCHHGEIL